MSTATLDHATVPLSGWNAIDASAGTGKTYAITQLYLRLLLEREGSGDEIVGQILVVTFTTAATAELRRRIRDTLLEARTILHLRSSGSGNGSSAPKADADPILSRIPEEALPGKIRKLDQALAGFDRAAIFTIHSFCQRVLSENAFEGGRPFECDLEAQGAALLSEAMEDFWRLHLANAHPALAKAALESGPLESPESLMKAMRSYVGMRDLRRIPDAPTIPADPAVFAAEYRTLDERVGDAFTKAKTAWAKSERAFDEFVDAAVIDGAHVNLPGRCTIKIKNFNKTNRPKYMASIENTLGKSATAPDDEVSCRLLDLSILEPAVDSGNLPDLSVFRAYDTLKAALADRKRGLRSQKLQLLSSAVPWATERIARRRAETRTQSYDDLLGNLLDALEGPGGERLATRLRERHPVALIDEFQDTDPSQFRILECIYSQGSGTVFLVGDPKQAIYSFRRADVFAYIAARERADHRYTLSMNRRSTEPLVKGVNALFEGPAPFLLGGVPAEPVGAIGDQDRGCLVTPKDGCPPLRILFFGRGEATAKPRTKGDANSIAIRETVRQISALLDPSPERRARIDGGRRPGPIRGGNIAVLVRKNKQANEVRKALAAKGIPSVLAVQSSVFGTDVAADLELVLRAVRDPSNERAIGAAFGTRLCGVGGAEVDLARSDARSSEAEAWASRVQRFREYNRRWASNGFVEMFRDLVEGEGMAERVLGEADGERRLTDLFHIGECLGSEASRGKRRIEALMKWFAESRREAGDGELGDDDDRRMRLETDDDLVQIATLHKSKGLEYDIVFLPFAWDGHLRAGDQGSAVRFHSGEGADYSVELDFGGPDYAGNKHRARIEERAENLRLFYVGVTRARHRCHVVWGAANENETSAPAWLFHHTDATSSVEDFEEAFKKRSDETLLRELEDLKARAPESISIELIDESARAKSLPREKPSDTNLSPRRWSASHRPRASRILSFSTLPGEGSTTSSSGDAGRTASISDEPEHASEREPVREEAAAKDPAEGFPAGKIVGKAIHKIFETVPLESLDAKRPEEIDRILQPIVLDALESYDLSGADQCAGPIGDAVRRTLVATLDRGWQEGSHRAAPARGGTPPLHLAGIPVERRQRELEFHFPLESVDGEAFAAAIRKDPLCSNLSPELDGVLEGYMKGYVDLVFQGDDGRFYVVDYKSNRVADDAASFTREAVMESMYEERYPLQSLLYTLALHRLLDRRLPKYDPEEHLGGSFYLYLRAIGLVPGDPGAGVVWLRHDVDALRELDEAVGTPGRRSGPRR